MLRNLNRTFSRGRVCGTPKSGTLGSAIPSTGSSGAGYTYNDLSLPADNNNEICGYITTWPSAGTLAANEDTSFTFTNAPDGIYTFQYQLYVNGVLTGSPATVTLSVGGTIVSCTVGDAIATGPIASVKLNTIINATVGNTIAAGSTAIVNQIHVINCGVGNSICAGSTASITQNTVVNCTTGNTLCNGFDASISQATTINCTIGNALCVGLNSTITSSSITYIKRGDRLFARLISGDDFSASIV